MKKRFQLRSCSTSPPGGNQVDGLPPAPSNTPAAPVGRKHDPRLMNSFFFESHNFKLKNLLIEKPYHLVTRFRIEVLVSINGLARYKKNSH